MLYTTLLAATAAFSGFAAAQNGTAAGLPPSVGPCCNVNVNSVSDSTRQEWCQASKNTCPEICGGQGQIASGGNECDPDTLQYTCKCRNGTQPAMAEYEQSVPGQMCNEWYIGCVNATISGGQGNAEQQFACETVKNSTCGTKKTEEQEAEASTSASGSSRPTASRSGGSSDSNSDATATPTGSEASGTATPGAAVRLGQDFGVPVLAGGLLAIFGMAL